MAGSGNEFRWIRVPVYLADGLIRLYQLILSPILVAFFGAQSGCRFRPSCSSYARGCLREHGLFKGTWLSLKRILRCHPWHPGGDDPVPEAKDCKQSRNPE